MIINKFQLSPLLLADLLNYPALEHTSSVKNFLPLQSDPATAKCAISCKIGDIDYKCDIYVNGSMKITPSPNGKKDEKIRFAIMGVDPIWTGAAVRERGSGNEDIEVPLASALLT